MSSLLWRVIFALLLLPAMAVAEDRPGLDAAKFPKPDPTSADEPVAATHSLNRAAEYLDRVAMTWLREHRCASCHTNYPYLMARPMLGDPNAPALIEMRRFFDARAAGWDRGGKSAGLPAEEDEAITEIVATASILAFDDARTGKIRPLTRQALDRMWTVQRADGSWNWNKHEEAPQEIDEYFGVVFAALGVGSAPNGYANSDSAREGVAKLKHYLKENPPPNLHHQAWLMWASLKLDGLMAQAQREQTIKSILALQRDDGGWNLPSLGDWKRQNGRPKRPKSAQRRLRHRLDDLHPSTGGHFRETRGDPKRRHLAQDASTRIRPLVHPLAQRRPSPLHHECRHRLRGDGVEGMRREEVTAVAGGGRQAGNPRSPHRGDVTEFGGQPIRILANSAAGQPGNGRAGMRQVNDHPGLVRLAPPQRFAGSSTPGLRILLAGRREPSRRPRASRRNDRAPAATALRPGPNRRPE